MTFCEWKQLIIISENRNKSCPLKLAVLKQNCYKRKKTNAAYTCYYNFVNQTEKTVIELDDFVPFFERNIFSSRRTNGAFRHFPWQIILSRSMTNYFVTYRDKLFRHVDWKERSGKTNKHKPRWGWGGGKYLKFEMCVHNIDLIKDYTDLQTLTRPVFMGRIDKIAM